MSHTRPTHPQPTQPKPPTSDQTDTPHCDTHKSQQHNYFTLQLLTRSLPDLQNHPVGVQSYAPPANSIECSVAHITSKPPHHPTTHLNHQPNMVSLRSQLNGKPSITGYSSVWPLPTMPHTPSTHSRCIQHKPSTSDQTDTHTEKHASQHYEITLHYNSSNNHSQTPQIAL